MAKARTSSSRWRERERGRERKDEQKTNKSFLTWLVLPFNVNQLPVGSFCCCCCCCWQLFVFLYLTTSCKWKVEGGKGQVSTVNLSAAWLGCLFLILLVYRGLSLVSASLVEPFAWQKLNRSCPMCSCVCVCVSVSSVFWSRKHLAIVASRCSGLHCLPQVTQFVFVRRTFHAHN